MAKNVPKAAMGPGLVAPKVKVYQKDGALATSDVAVQFGNFSVNVPEHYIDYSMVDMALVKEKWVE